MSLGSLVYPLWWVLDQLAEKVLFSAVLNENCKINCLPLPATGEKAFAVLFQNLNVIWVGCSCCWTAAIE